MSKKKNTNITPIIYRAVDLDVDLNKIVLPKHINFTKTGLSSVRNAWLKYAVIDNVGYVWIHEDGLRNILRMGSRKKSAKEFVDFNIPEIHKRTINGIRYIRIEFISAHLIGNISNFTNSISKRNYSLYSQRIMNKLNESHLLESIRSNIREKFLKSKSKLKRDRANEFGVVTYDELTGEKLNDRRAEFSHIRSISHYPDLALFYWNGLIVNKSTHIVITKRGVNNEKALYDLCYEKDWKRNWVHIFKTHLEDQGYTSLI